MSMIDTCERSWFPHLKYTKIAVLDDIEDVDNPQLGELLSPDVTYIDCDLTADGFEVSRRDGTVTHTPWWGNHQRTFPDRWSTTMSLQSWVPSQGATCRRHSASDECCKFGTLWDLSCRFRAPAVIVVRRGKEIDRPFRVGDEVEVLRGRWGVRNVAPLGTGDALFTVAFMVEQEVGFDPNSLGCAVTTKVVPGTTPLPPGTALCTSDLVTLCGFAASPLCSS